MIKNKNKWLVALMLVGSVALMALCLPPGNNRVTYDYTEGKPWHYPMLTAPFDSVTARHKIDSINANFIKIYSQDLTAASVQVSNLNKALTRLHDVPAGIRQQIVANVSSVYDDGIVDNDTYDQIKLGKLPQVRLLNSNIAELTSTAKFRSVRAAYFYLDSVMAHPAIHAAMANVGLNNYLVPNVTIDSVETSKLLDDVYKKELAPNGVVQTGESIIFPGNIVTPQKFMILKTYEKMMQQHNMAVSRVNYVLIGQILLIVMMVVIFFFVMYFSRMHDFANIRLMVLLISFTTIFVMLVYVFTSFRLNAVYVVPFALVPIVITTFYDKRMAFFLHMFVVLLCSLVARFQLEFVLLQFMAGCIGIVTMNELTRRSQLVNGAFYIFLAYCVTYVALTLVKDGSLATLSWHVIMCFGINCVVLSFAYFLISLIEKIFGFTSVMTLVELSDISSPVLRELSDSCPGTFQHSLQVASLAAEAAHDIGANVQLTRAGALYHDIGKIENPAFFTENQNGVNPHDSLSPEQSARIVISHVADGLRRAEKANLPQAITDFIAQHHGKSIAKFFYVQACNANPGKVIDPAPFTYPGPNPQSKETAIVMLADSCEAAAKSLTDHSKESIKALVDKVVDSKVKEGLLNEAPISFRDIMVVKNTFVERLQSFYHVRVSYPDEIKQRKTEESAAAPTATDGQ